MRAGRVVLIVVGALVALIGFGFTAGGVTLVWANATQRDASGYYNTSTDRLTTPTYALTASVDFGTHASQGDLWVPVHPAGTVRCKPARPTASSHASLALSSIAIRVGRPRYRSRSSCRWLANSAVRSAVAAARAARFNILVPRIYADRPVVSSS